MKNYAEKVIKIIDINKGKFGPYQSSYGKLENNLSGLERTERKPSYDLPMLDTVGKTYFKTKSYS